MAKLIPRLSLVFKPTKEFSHKDVDKFIELINTTPDLGPNGDCWEWAAGLFTSGYGQVRLAGHPYRTHRVSYSLFNNIELDSKEYICHSCDNIVCVNPNHLFLGDALINMRDKINKHRDKYLSHDNHPLARLTQANVEEIRQLYASGKYTQKQLANLFGVARTNISLIVNNKRWR